MVTATAQQIEDVQRFAATHKTCAAHTATDLGARCVAAAIHGTTRIAVTAWCVSCEAALCRVIEFASLPQPVEDFLSEIALTGGAGEAPVRH